MTLCKTGRIAPTAAFVEETPNDRTYYKEKDVNRTNSVTKEEVALTHKRVAEQR